VSIFEPIEISASAEGVSAASDDTGTDSMLAGSLMMSRDRS
jgi:hypothetical protein